MLAGLSSHAALAARAAQFRLLEERPADNPRVAVIGTDPIRILILGAGLAAGYGVSSYRQTLAGTLAARLAESTNRGVIIDIRATPVLPSSAAVGFISPVGAHTYHAAVFASSHFDSAVLPGFEIARYAQRIQDHILSTGSPTMQLVILGVPQPSTSSRMDRLARQAAARANNALARSATGHPRVTFTPTPDYRSTHEPKPFTAPYYATLGDAVADALLPTFEHPTRRPKADPPHAGPVPPESTSDAFVPFDFFDVSYSSRVETPREVLANRVKVTSSLFVTAIGMAVLLGRRR